MFDRIIDRDYNGNEIWESDINPYDEYEGYIDSNGVLHLYH